MYNAQLPPNLDLVNPNLVEWVANQFREIETELRTLALNGLPKLYVEPEKPREGRFANADGTTWNPGAGAGIYVYHAGTWKKVHA